MKLILLCVLVVAFTNANSQRLVFVFGHGEYASPVGKLRNSNNAGLGLEAGLGVGLGKTFVTGTLGTTWLFVNKHGTISKGGLRYTPVRFGLRKYILTKNLFVKAEAGVAGMKVVDTDNKNTKFTSSFGAGLKFTRMEALVDYNSVSGGYGSWFGLKFGFNFGL